MQIEGNNDDAMRLLIEKIRVDFEDLRIKLGDINNIDITKSELNLNSTSYQGENINTNDINERKKFFDIPSSMILEVQKDSLEAAEHYANHLKNNFNKKLNKRSFCQLIQEFEWLYLHCIDRCMYKYVDDISRIAFMDDLCKSVIKSNISHDYLFIGKAKKNEITRNFLREYVARTTTYINYKKMLPDIYENIKGTLLLEFSKDISSKFASNENFTNMYLAVCLAANDIIMFNLQVKVMIKIFM